MNLAIEMYDGAHYVITSMSCGRKEPTIDVTRAIGTFVVERANVIIDLNTDQFIKNRETTAVFATPYEIKWFMRDSKHMSAGEFQGHVQLYYRRATRG